MLYGVEIRVHAVRFALLEHDANVVSNVYVQIARSIELHASWNHVPHCIYVEREQAREELS